MTTEKNELIPRTTLVQMVATWKTAGAKIRQACALLMEAQTELQTAFQTRDSYYFRFHGREGIADHLEHPDKFIDGKLKQEAWKALVTRMELHRVLSVKRSKELDSQLDTGKDLPDITEECINGWLTGTAFNVATFMQEAVKEVYDFLRPRNSKLKTNSEFEVGKKVIRFGVEPGYNGGWRIKYHYHSEFRALDNVFHLLDGKGYVDTYNGPFIDAIEKSNGEGESDYFKFHCYGNGNCHIEFKRMDLVTELNAIAGGRAIKPKGKNHTPPEPKPQPTPEPEPTFTEQPNLELQLA